MSSKHEDLSSATGVPTHHLAEMETETFSGLLHTLQTAAIAALIFAVCVYLPKLKIKVQLRRLPVLSSSESGEKQRQSFLASAQDMYREGHAKFKDSVYRIVSESGEEHVVIPFSLLPEVRKLPDDVLSLPSAIYDSLEVKYTHITTDEKLSVHSIKSDLTPALVRLNPTICAEVDAALRKHMPPCQDWTEVCINSKLVDVVAKVSGRVFVGPELSEDPEYLDCGSNYTIDLVNAIRAIKKIRPWLKPILAPRLPEVVQLRQREKRAAEYLRPIIEERMTAKSKDPNWQEPDDMLQWMINRNHGTKSVNEITGFQLGLIFAAIHTTTMTATNILYTLAVTPEYIEPLREEIRNAMAANDGVITSRALQQMPKLDSYMKEVTRYYPPGLTTFGRRVLKPITLSNGQHIPAGTLIETPSAAIYADSTHYPSPTTFDGYRSYNLRSSGAAVDIARNQFVTTNEINLGFGYGRHACPGRFFAANEIKMILTRLILEYDVKMPGESTERYKQVVMGRESMPDPEKTLLFRRVV